MQKIFSLNSLRWFFGAIFILMSFSLVKEKPITSIFQLFIGILLLPPLSNLLDQLVKKPIPGTVKLLAGIVLMYLAIAFDPASTQTQEEKTAIVPSITPTQSVTQTPTLTSLPTTAAEPSGTVMGVSVEVTPIATPTSTVTPSSVPTVYVKPTSTPRPYFSPTSAPVKVSTQSSGGSWSCSCSKTCDEMASCQEAYYQLNTCGCSKRDADHDGVPCESLCR